MSKHVVSRVARRHIDKIWSYIATDSVSAAEQWLARLEHTFKLIGNTPGIGRVRTDLIPAAVKVWPFESYLILYTSEDPGVQIAGVVHASRNWPKLAGRGII